VDCVAHLSPWGMILAQSEQGKNEQKSVAHGGKGISVSRQIQHGRGGNGPGTASQSKT